MMKKNLDKSVYQDESFEKINLSDVMIRSVVFTDCRFAACDFRNSQAENCAFRNCLFENCKLNLWRLSGSVYSGCKFIDCDMSGIDWTAANLPKLRLCCPLAFENCRLNHSSFFGLDLSELKARNCLIKETDLRNAILCKAVFQNCDFNNSLFGNTDLREANFTRARNYLINLARNNCQDAEFSLPEALNLLTTSGIKLS